MPQRYIAHMDLDTFFVSVARLEDPSLVGKPVIIGGSRERGVVSTCSYEARKFGVTSAMPMKKAIALCPDAIVTSSSRGEYTRYSRWVTQIIANKAPAFEKASIDEFYIDLTGMDHFFDPLQWTIDLRAAITEETGLPISFGLASNKMVAKIATDEAKPNGYLFVQPGKEQEFLAPLKVEKISGVGRQSVEILHEIGIKTIGDILKVPVTLLEKKLGKWGADLYERAQGIHFGEVSNEHLTKSISTERTYDQYLSDSNDMLAELVYMAEKVAHSLRTEGFMTGCVGIKIRYPNFETVQKQKTIDYTFAEQDIIPVIKELFQQLYQPGKEVRLIGVRLTELGQHALQGSLFNDQIRKAHLYAAIDAVKNKYGKSAIRRAGGKQAGK
ncbi:MAG: DNA polymerase IV [Hydrotalea sp.]|nr:DNA polymerase IV [Hydrotalea sp.]